MRAFLLAAGRGTRISRNIKKTPKCLLDVDGKPLLLHTIEMLQKNGFEVTVVVGYLHQMIEKAVAPYQVEVLYNPFYENTNSMGSLWFARESLQKEDELMLIANADVFWSQEILDEAMAYDQKMYLLSDVTHAVDGDYYFYTVDDKIVKYGKELKPEERNTEYVGIAFLKGEAIEKFRTHLGEMVDAGKYQLWWENVLYDMTPEQPVYALDVAGRFWGEIDYIDDYERILAYLRDKA